MSGDPYYNYTSLLLPFTGANNSTVFTDYSLSPKTITVAGNTKISTTQSKWGVGSGYFDGNGDYLSVSRAIPVSADFTAEAWCYLRTHTTEKHILSQMDLSGAAIDGRFTLMIDASTGLLRCFIGASSGHLSLPSSTAVPLSQWAHIAVSRASNIFILFINGVLTATSANYATAICNLPTNVGVYYLGAYFTGYLQDLRITSGIARYTADFTPPAAALPTFQDLTCNAVLLPPLLTCAPGAVSGPPMAGLLAEPMRRYDSEDGGRVHVAGQVTIGGSPAARKVRLHTLHNGRLIREAWSDPVTGAYRFDDLKDQPYYVWSEDYQRVYDPVSHLVPNLS